MASTKNQKGSLIQKNVLILVMKLDLRSLIRKELKIGPGRSEGLRK